MPKVTVLMPVYNAERYLREAINSILGQDFSDFEFLIIDDGSTDGSAAVIASCADSRFRVLSHGQNWGIVRTLNQGLAAAGGDYIARMDSDDVSLPARLRQQVRFMDENPDVAVCGTFYRSFGAGRERTVRLPRDPETLRTMLLFASPLAHPTVMIRRSFLVSHDLSYREEDRHFEDMGLWKECAERGRIANLPRVLLRYRLSPGGVSRQEKLLQERERALLGYCSRRLDELGMQYDERSLRAYHSLVSLRDPPADIYPDAAAFLRSLCVNNRRTGQYPHGTLTRLCGRMWFTLCYVGCRHGLKTLRLYASEMGSFSYVPSLPTAAKFLLRAALGKRT
jgi:glycosyltransferase involved in cell wall biosynthesis